jgi:hypothetical protein
MADVLDTAHAIARCRAAEGGRPADERLFEDPLARLFAGDGDAGAEDAVAAFARVPFFAEQVRLRTRYLDDLVRAEIARGARDVVVPARASTPVRCASRRSRATASACTRSTSRSSSRASAPRSKERESFCRRTCAFSAATCRAPTRSRD